MIFAYPLSWSQICFPFELEPRVGALATGRSEFNGKIHETEKTRSVRIRINIRTTENEPVVGIIYDSATDKFVKIRKFFPFIGPTGGTPEGLTFEAILHELLEDVKNTLDGSLSISLTVNLRITGETFRILGCPPLVIPRHRWTS